LTLRDRSGQQVRAPSDDQQQELLHAFRNALRSHGWFIHHVRYGRVVAHPKGAKIPLPDNVSAIVRLFPACIFQFRRYWGQLYLCLDYSLEVRTVLSVQELLSVFEPGELLHRSALARWDNSWQRAQILAIDNEWTQVRFLDFESEDQLPSAKVIPH